MSGFDSTPKGKTTGKGNAAGWTEHEVLFHLLCAMELASWQLDYNNAPVPDGRNAKGCRQKINKVKNALRSEIDALKAGKAATPRKRKAKADDDGNVSENTPKKGRGRSKKKAATSGSEEDQEKSDVKSEPKDEEFDEGDEKV